MFLRRNWFFFNAPDGNPGGAASTNDSGTTNQIDSIAELFNFSSSVQEDSQSANVTGQAAGAGQPENVPQGQQGASAPNDPAAQTPSSMAGQQPQQTPAVSQADIAELRGQIQGLFQVANSPLPQQPQQQQGPQVPDFSVQVPDELVQGLAAEDPIMRKRSLEALGSGLGQMVLQRSQQQLMQLYQHISTAIPQMVASMIAQNRQMSQWHDDFYGDFKEFGTTPQMKQVVANVAAQLAQQGKIRDLSKESHKLVAEGVLMALGFQPQQIATFFANRGRQRQQAAAVVQQTGRPVMAGAQARQMGSGNPTDPNSPQGISDLLFSGGLR